MDDPSRPDFGPSGYLPDRAARRARKIVLRAPLGLQWVIASLLAGVVVVVAGVLFLRGGSDPPPPPWQDIGEVSTIGAARWEDDLDVLIVGTAGRIRAFAAASDVRYCDASNRLESPRGVWSLTGRGFGGVTSLSEHPTLVHDGRVYVDVTRTAPGPPPADDPAERACG